jgi:long-chain acyl-CoA synthetase
MRGAATALDAPTLPELLAARAAATPETVAFMAREPRGGWRPVTWRAFHESVTALSGALRRAGLEPGARIGILAPTSVEWETVQMASLGCGAVAVGIDPNYPDDQLNAAVRDARLGALVAEDASALGRVSTENRAAIGLLLTIRPGPPGSTRGGTSVPELLAGARGVARASPAVAPTDGAIVTFSSGTTGAPKPILYTHAQARAAIRAIVGAFPQIGAGSRLLCWLPLANLFQRMIDFCAIAAGATSYVIGEPREVMTHIASARPRLLIGVPRFFERVHDAVSARAQAAPGATAKLFAWALTAGDRHARAVRDATPLAWLERLRWQLADRFVLRRVRSIFGGELEFLVSGSAPMPVRLLEWFDAIGLPVYEAYGVSECIIPVAVNRPGERRLGTVGRPLQPAEIKLAEDGEILVRGPGVFSGYLFAEATSPRPDAAGFWATGDLGTLEGDGFLRVAGRKGDLFKTSTGRWVSPVRIEERLCEIPYVEHAVAVGAGRKAIAALLEIEPRRFAERVAERSTRPDPEQLVLGSPERSALRADVATAVADLGPQERPAAVLVTTQPFSAAGGELTSNLKLRRGAIEAKYASRIERLFAAAEGAGAGELTIDLA